MTRTTELLIVLVAATSLALACGGEGTTDAPVDSAPPAEAPEPRTGAPAADAGAPAETPPATPASVQRCLDLVKAAKFEQAVPKCLEAAGVDPENADVQQALEKAQAEVAKTAAADAAGKAADEAADAASGALGDAAKGMGDM